MVVGKVSSQTSVVHTLPSSQSALVSHSLTSSHTFDRATPCWTIACAMDGIVATTNMIARINSIHRIVPLLLIFHSFLFLIFFTLRQVMLSSLQSYDTTSPFLSGSGRREIPNQT